MHLTLRNPGPQQLSPQISGKHSASGRDQGFLKYDGIAIKLEVTRDKNMN
jgi:hypothetical protein